MALKLLIDQAAYDALSEGHKAAYTKVEATGKYKLDVDPEDIPDVEGLRRKNQELLDEKKTEKQKREEAERERAKAAGDITALEKSWETRLATETGTLKTERDAAQRQLERLTVGRAATEIAAELAVVTNGVSSAKALLPHVERRLSMEAAADGEIKVRVLDATGKPSAMTLEQLKDEFKNDPVFAPLIQATKAGGGGGDGNKNNGGGNTDKPFGEMTVAERTALHQKDPAKFKKLSDEHRARR